jgi:biotin carboxylase
MTDSSRPTILCVASFFKGNDFIRQCHEQGARVVLLTREKLLSEDWARESLADVIAIPGKASLQSYLAAACHLARRHRVSRVVALEEYDIVTAAYIREHLCVPGMSTTTARRFQDKLSMRARAREIGIAQAEFVPLVNFEVIDEFMKRTAPPWMLKPRIGASSMGIKKLHEPEEVWREIAQLDATEAFHESSAFHLIERYIPGDVYHVDSLVENGTILFASVERYGTPPFTVSHSGGVTISHSVKRGSPEQRYLFALNKKLLAGFGFKQGVTHAEFILGANAVEAETVRTVEFGMAGNVSAENISRSGKRRASLPPESNQFYFLECAARVGGAYTAETMAASTGLNPWREWAKIELATPEQPYTLPPVRQEYGGIALSLARQKHPCTSRYNDAEIVHRVRKPWHVGLIVRSPDYGRVIELLSRYSQRFSEDFTAVGPPEELPEQPL